MVEVHSQKLNVWTGILGDRVLEPFFIDGNLTIEKYENILRNEICADNTDYIRSNFNDVSTEW